jgi:hypothetical protein
VRACVSVVSESFFITFSLGFSLPLSLSIFFLSFSFHQCFFLGEYSTTVSPRSPSPLVILRGSLGQLYGGYYTHGSRCRAACLTSCYKFVHQRGGRRRGRRRCCCCCCVCVNRLLYNNIEVERTTSKEEDPSSLPAQGQNYFLSMPSQKRAMFDGWLRISCSIAHSSTICYLLQTTLFCHPCHSGRDG